MRSDQLHILFEICTTPNYKYITCVIIFFLFMHVGAIFFLILYHVKLTNIYIYVERCDVFKLVNDILMRERGAGAAEKHFPSRISLQLTPTIQQQVLTVSVGKSSENPRIEFGVEKGIEASFEPPNPYIGLSVSAGESTTVSLKPWKFEQSVHGYSANLNWFLHDSTDGKEVFSTKPSKVALFNPKSWFKDRYYPHC